MKSSTSAPPAAAPVDPSVVDAAPETRTSPKTKSPRKRTSIRSLRLDIANLEMVKSGLHENIDRLASRLDESISEQHNLENQLTIADSANDRLTKRVVNLQTALEFVLSIAVMDKSPIDASKLLIDKADEFGFDFRVISVDVLEALGKAYAKAPSRVARAANHEHIGILKEKFDGLMKGVLRPSPGVRVVSGSGIGSLLDLLTGRGSDSSEGAVSADLLSDLLGDYGDLTEGEPRNTADTFFHSRPDCKGHPRR